MIRNIISTFFSRSSAAFINLCILLLASRQLGSELWGQISLLVLNISIVHTINEIYTGAALVYFIPRSLLGKLYTTGLLWMCGTTLLVSLGFLMVSADAREQWPHLLFLSILVTMHSFHNVILLGKEKIRMYNFLVFLQPALLLCVLIINIFVLNQRSLDAYICAMYLSYGIPVIFSTLAVLKVKNTDTENVKTFDAPAVFQNGFINQLGNLAHMLSNRFNYYLLASAALVGVYASATSLIESLWIISGSVSPIVLTFIANQKDVNNNGRITLFLSKVCFLLSLLCVLVLYFMPSAFFTFLLGKDFDQVKTVMLYLSPGVLCISFSNIISHYFSGLGKQKTLLVANTFGLLTTLCSSYFLIKTHGLIGACIAASLSYFMQALVLTLVFMRTNKFGLKELFLFGKDTELLKE